MRNNFIVTAKRQSINKVPVYFFVITFSDKGSIYPKISNNIILN